MWPLLGLQKKIIDWDSDSCGRQCYPFMASQEVTQGLVLSQCWLH